MVKTPAIYRLSPIYHFWHFWCDFCNFCVFFLHFFVFLGAFFCIFMCLIMKTFGVHFLRFLWVFFYCVHFLLPPIVEVDISDIAIISVIPDMVKATISGITNTPQKVFRIAQ
jgi:hypothetical protein